MPDPDTSNDGQNAPNAIGKTDPIAPPGDTAPKPPRTPRRGRHRRESLPAALSSAPSVVPSLSGLRQEEAPFRYGPKGVPCFYLPGICGDQEARAHLLRFGADDLSDIELLTLLLITTTERYQPADLARQLLATFGSLRGLADATLEEIADAHGTGKERAARIKAAIAFGIRATSIPPKRPRINAPQDVYDLLGPLLISERREHFVALLLDVKGGLIRQYTVSIGDLSSSVVHPREVFREAVRYGAAAIIVAHNHPSGDPAPSPEDEAITCRLCEAGELMGIHLLDHVILGDGRWASLKERLQDKLPGKQRPQ